MFAGSRLLSLVFVAVGAVASLPAETARLPAGVEDAIARITAGELRAHVEALASDEMGGRAVGQPGNDRAVQYVAEALRASRVEPAGDTYFQQVELYHATSGPAARLTVSGRINEVLHDFTAGPSFYPLPESAEVPVTGQLVFAGHGISAPRLGHDDYARRKVERAIVLVHDDAPEALLRRAGLTADERGQLSTIERKITDAHEHGAVGVIVVRAGLSDVGAVWPAASTARTTNYRPYGRIRSMPVAAVVISQQAAGPIKRELDAGVKLAVTINPGIEIHRVTVPNVLGTVDPAGASEELVVVGAHLDHDGVHEDGRVYNGADDNASGTAAVLAMAAAFTKASAGQRPRRRVVFALWNAEEKGSLGAEAYIAPLPPGRVIANVNLDMIGRGEANGRTNAVHMLGYSYSPDFAALARRANEAIGLTVKEEYDRDAQNLIQRSDNWPFLKRGIPALFFTTGLHPDYHTPDDDTDRLDFEKLERITELASRLTWLVADGQPPRFKQTR